MTFPLATNRGRNSKRWRGQRQKWAAMLFEGDEDEIVLDAHEQIEFIAWDWVKIEKIPDLVVPFKRGIYRELCRRLQPAGEIYQGPT